MVSQMAEENVLDLLVLLTPNMNRVRVITTDPIHSKFTMDPSMDLFTMDPIHRKPQPSTGCDGVSNGRGERARPLGAARPEH